MPEATMRPNPRSASSSSFGRCTAATLRRRSARAAARPAAGPSSHTRSARQRPQRLQRQWDTDGRRRGSVFLCPGTDFDTRHLPCPVVAARRGRGGVPDRSRHGHLPARPERRRVGPRAAAAAAVGGPLGRGLRAAAADRRLVAGAGRGRACAVFRTARALRGLTMRLEISAPRFGSLHGKFPSFPGGWCRTLQTHHTRGDVNGLTLARDQAALAAVGLAALALHLLWLLARRLCCRRRPKKRAAGRIIPATVRRGAWTRTTLDSV
jgi:hypothetical protein